MRAYLQKFKVSILILVLGLIWGSSFILMKRGLLGFPSDQIAAIRLSFACLALLPFHWQYRKYYRNLPWRFLAIVGLAGNGIPAFLFAYGQIGLPSATVGILNSLTPVFTLLVGAVIFTQSISVANVLGVFIGLAGACGLILLRTGGSLEMDMSYGAWIIFATLLYAISINTIRHKLQGIPPLAIACLALSIVGVPAFVYLLSTDFFSRMETRAAQQALPYILILAVVGTAFSLVLFNKLVQHSGALPASSVTYLIPIVALAWGFLDGEVLGWGHIAGVVGILCGITLVNMRKPLVGIRERATVQQQADDLKREKS